MLANMPKECCDVNHNSAISCDTPGDILPHLIISCDNGFKRRICVEINWHFVFFGRWIKFNLIRQ